MSKKANPDEKKVQATEARVEQAVEKKDQADKPKLSVHEKARIRKAELGKIIAYALLAASEDRSPGTDEDKEAIKALCAKYSKPQKDLGEPTWSKKLRDILGGKKEIHEDDIWLTHKFGRETMQNLIKDAVRREKPSLRFWVNFDESTGIYTAHGEGKDEPAGYPVNGIRPKERVAVRAERKPAGSSDAETESQSA